VLTATASIGPRLTHPVPSPNWREFTINEEIVAVVDTFAVRTFIEEATRDPVLTVKELRNGGKVTLERYPAEPRPLTVDVRERVDTYPEEPSPTTVETKLLVSALVIAVEKEEKAREIEFVVEIREVARVAEETYPIEPSPATVESRFDVLAIVAAVEKEEKVREIELVVEIRDDVRERVDTYPEEPRPTTVETKLLVSALVIAVEKEE
jgi:hypothetical protein